MLGLAETRSVRALYGSKLLLLALTLNLAAHPRRHRMSIKVSRRHLLAISPLTLVLLSYVYAFQTTPSERIKGAIVQFRIYDQTVDGVTKETGTKTAYLSTNGNWSVIKRNARGGTDQTLIADANRGGVFLIDSGNTATKVGNFLPNTKAISKSQYRQNSQFRGEATFLGYEAYLEKLEDNNKLITELTWIPFLRLPVKIVHFHDDGSKTVEEAVSLELREPDENKVKVPDKIVVTADLSDQLRHPRKGGEKLP